MATVVPGRYQQAFDLSITQATSPQTIYTVPAGYVLYLDYLYVNVYAGTWATATPGIQVIIDQGSGNPSCAVMRNYIGTSYVYEAHFTKPMIATVNVVWACLLSNAAAAFSGFIVLGGDVV